MVQTQITRIRNFDGFQTLRKHSDDSTLPYSGPSDGSTLPYSGPNLTTMLSGVTDHLFVLKRIDDNGTTEGSTYPFKFVARDQTEFTTANFDTVWNQLLSNPDRPLKL
jgi:hypothetical protein